MSTPACRLPQPPLVPERGPWAGQQSWGVPSDTGGSSGQERADPSSHAYQTGDPIPNVPVALTQCRFMLVCAGFLLTHSKGTFGLHVCLRADAYGLNGKAATAVIPLCASSTAGRYGGQQRGCWVKLLPPGFHYIAAPSQLELSSENGQATPHVRRL